jgi:hypothetical protein
MIFNIPEFRITISPDLLNLLQIPDKTIILWQKPIKIDI